MLGKERISRQTRWLIYLSVLVLAILLYVFWPKGEMRTSVLTETYFEARPLKLDAEDPPAIQPRHEDGLTTLVYHLSVSDTVSARTLILAGNIAYALGDDLQATDLYTKARELAERQNKVDLVNIADSNLQLVGWEGSVPVNTP